MNQLNLQFTDENINYLLGKLNDNNINQVKNLGTKENFQPNVSICI